MPKQMEKVSVDYGKICEELKRKNKSKRWLSTEIGRNETSLIAEMYVTMTQNGKTVLEKTLSDCNCSGTSVSLTLTQEDTLKLQQQPRSQAEIQIRVRTTAGEALASDIMSVYVGRILKEGVI